jgi:hypothetical protein
MVMLVRQLDGSMGPSSPFRIDNQPGAINAPAPGSVGARALQANSGGPLAAVAQRSFESPQPTQTKTIAEEKSTGPGAGANRGSARGSRRRMMGTAGTAFAGNVGSVNTEEQNDDVLLPYMKGNA